MPLRYWMSRHFVAPRATAMRRFALCVACIAVTACDVTDDARLLVLRGIDAREVVLGDSLTVRGDGFPTGAACSVELRGELWQPGSQPQSIDVSIRGRAISRDEVAANVDASALPAIDAHATFHGRLALRFLGADGVSRVSGVLPAVSFDLLPHEVDLAQRHAQLRRARATLGLLGILLEDDQESGTGLRVRWAAEGSVAAVAGLRQGDVLTHAGGLRLQTTADLAPAAGASEIRLRVQPSTTPTERIVSLSLATVQQPELGHVGQAVSATAVLVVLCLVWLAPVPRRLVRFRSMPASAPGSARPLAWVLLWPLSASLFWIALAVGERWQLPWHLVPVAALIASVHLVTTTLSTGRSPNARELVDECGCLLFALSPLACAGLIGGSMGVAGIVDQQGGLPWQWFVFRAPPLLLACVVFLAGARRLIDRARVNAGATAYAIVLAGIGAAVFLGGWGPIDLGLTPLLDPAVVGIVLFAVKAWAMTLLLALPRQRDVAEFSTPSWLGVCLLAVGLSVLWMRLPIVPAVQVVVAHSLCGATFAVLLLQLWRVQRAPALRLQ